MKVQGQAVRYCHPDKEKVNSEACREGQADHRKTSWQVLEDFRVTLEVENESNRGRNPQEGMQECVDDVKEVWCGVGSQIGCVEHQ